MLRPAADIHGTGDLADLRQATRHLQESLPAARHEYFRVARPRRKLSLLLEPALARRAMRNSGLARPDWNRVDRLVFACLGNICRSAYASTVIGEFGLPTAAYQVSGEFSMIEAAAERGWLDRERTVLESLIGIRRAGADAILTYFAMDAARWLS